MTLMRSAVLALIGLLRSAVVAVAADAGRELVLLDAQRRLAHLVDHAAGLAAAEEHGAGAAQHVDLLVVEGFAVVLRGIADAIEIHVAEGVEAAQIHVVAGTAALGGVEAEARHVAQGFAQAADLLLFHQRVGDGGHRLRYVMRVLQHLADARGGGAVAVGFVGIGLDADGGQFFRGFLGHGGQRRGADQQQCVR
jgi:hypothetical protein